MDGSIILNILVLLRFCCFFNSFLSLYENILFILRQVYMINVLFFSSKLTI